MNDRKLNRLNYSGGEHWIKQLLIHSINNMQFNLNIERMASLIGIAIVYSIRNIVNTSISSASLIDLTIFFDALAYLEGTFPNIIPHILEEVLPFLLSEALKPLLQSGDFKQLYSFFKKTGKVIQFFRYHD